MDVSFLSAKPAAREGLVHRVPSPGDKGLVAGRSCCVTKILGEWPTVPPPGAVAGPLAPVWIGNPGYSNRG